MKSTGERFTEFVEIIRRLRDPNGGCPWDLQQTHDSLRPYVVEETYEVLDAIERKDDDELKKELGDLLLQVVLHAQMARDRKAFSIDEVLSEITEKMIRRHPHVFGSVEANTPDEVVKNWEMIKHQERAAKGGSDAKPSMLASVPPSLPALIRAQRLGEKAAKVSFDWSDISGVWDKVREELGELEEELKTLSHEKLEHELGDLLFSLCQLARWLHLSAEDSLRACCGRFIGRFHKMESLVKRPLSDLSESELEAAWQQAKSSE